MKLLISTYIRSTNFSILWCMLVSCMLYNRGLASVSTNIIPRSGVYSPAYANLDRSQKTVSVFLEYNQTFQPHKIATNILTNSTLRFAGSLVSPYPTGALRADDLGLDPHYDGLLHVNPVIQNVTATIYHVMDLSPFIDRLYVTFLAPICNTRWDLNPCQTIIAESHTLPAAYQSAAQSTAIPSLRDAFSANSLFGDNLRGVGYQQIDWCGARSLTTLAGFLITCGRNFVYDDRARFSWFGMFNFPSSNTPDPTFLFNPIAGNGHYCEIGAGVEGWVNLTSCDNPLAIRWYAQGAAQYLIKTYQLRTFDLQDQGPLSRYLLLKQIDPATGQYTGTLLNATYATTYGVYTQRPIQGTISSKINMEWRGWCGNLGYQLYGVAQEKISLAACRPTCVAFGNTYGIKGTSGAYAFNVSGSTITTTTPLNSTEHTSTMLSAGPVDSPVELPNTTTWSNVANGQVVDPSIVAVASNTPWKISCSDINIASGAAPAQIAQSIFGEWGYTWPSSADGRVRPSWLLGAFVEFVSPGKGGFSLWGAWSRVTVDF